MSRSFKRHPGDGVCKYRSNKRDKRAANGLLRARNREMMNALRDIVDFEVLEEVADGLSFYNKPSQVSDVWSFNSDGFKWHGEWVQECREAALEALNNGDEGLWRENLANIRSIMGK